MYIKNGETKSYHALKQLYPNLSFPKDSPPDGWQEYEKPEPTLDELKQRKKNEINAERDRLETAGFLFNGVLFDSDQRSADRIQIATIAANSSLLNQTTFSVNWRDMDNNEHELDAQGMLALTKAFANHGMALHEQAKALKTQVDACTTKEEVDAITWS